MPILKSETKGSAAQRFLLAAGAGGVFGLQSCRLARYLGGDSLSWYDLAWVLAGHVLLGVTIAATAARACWWKRGPALGLLFALPWAAHAYLTGARWAGAAEAIAGPLAGLLIALLADLLFAASRPAEAARGSRSVPQGAGGEPPGEPDFANLRQRLAEELAQLERLDDERERHGDPRRGKAAEDRIVWGELLELELQDIDERLSRICNAEGAGGRRASRPADSGPRKGESHERDDS